jgi:hypothetical protein
MSIVYNYFDFSSCGMSKAHINMNDLLRYLPKDQKCKIVTNIKYHCGDSSNEFIINVINGKITNEGIIDKINNYLEKNNSRSYFFEGLVAQKNGFYSLYWGS